ncbi:MAG: ribonuclease E inhibitor RraB [Pseudomonadota bacterium]|nr:ribonuclease E inhibitor RraB [Pseudomonadota bacterium]
MLPNDSTGSALKRMQDDGTDLTKPILMDFFLAASSKEILCTLNEEVSELGFDSELEFDSESNEWTLFCAKTIIPSYVNVVAIEEQLTKIALEYGGYYDGFGSYGN